MTTATACSASMADPGYGAGCLPAKPESRHDMTDWIDKWQQRREQGYGVEYAVLVADAVVGSIALYDYSPDNRTRRVRVDVARTRRCGDRSQSRR